jgi:hypothetical protein
LILLTAAFALSIALPLGGIAVAALLIADLLPANRIMWRIINLDAARHE